MVVCHRHYEKQDVVDDLAKVRHGKNVHRGRVDVSCSDTLFKKAKKQQSRISVEGMRRGTKPPITADL